MVTGGEREGGLGSWHAGTETGDAQVRELTCVAGGDAGSDTGDTHVGRWTCVVAKVGNRVAGRAG